MATTEEVQSAVTALAAAVESSNLDDASKSLILEAATPTLRLWQEQLSRMSTTGFKGERVIEGPGYKVSLSVGRQPSRLLAYAKKIRSGFSL
jgi:hypothetical protein